MHLPLVTVVALVSTLFKSSDSLSGSALASIVECMLLTWYEVKQVARVCSMDEVGDIVRLSGEVESVPSLMVRSHTMIMQIDCVGMINDINVGALLWLGALLHYPRSCSLPRR